MDLYQHRNPHALVSWTRMARYLDLAFEFKKLALGLDSPNPLPEKITYDYELTGLKRGYAHLLDPAPPAAAPVLPVVPVGRLRHRKQPLHIIFIDAICDLELGLLTQLETKL